MKELTIISGKGGTGKTTLTASLVALTDNAVVCDCDVDAANLHLLLDPKMRKEFDIYSQKLAIIDEEKCTECGLCVESCRFNAIKGFKVDSVKCEGCGVCEYVCPVDAIRLIDSKTAKIINADTKYGPFLYGCLYAGAGTSGKVVSEIRKKASDISREVKSDFIIIDGSPGIGCPVIASITGCDAVLTVVEPTLSGDHDMKRILSLTEYFGIKTFVCINKYDINKEITEKIEDICREEDVEIAGKIPYNPVVTEAMVGGMPVVEYVDNELTDEIKKIHERIFCAL